MSPRTNGLTHTLDGDERQERRLTDIVSTEQQRDGPEREYAVCAEVQRRWLGDRQQADRTEQRFVAQRGALLAIHGALYPAPISLALQPLVTLKVGQGVLAVGARQAPAERRLDHVGTAQT